MRAPRKRLNLRAYRESIVVYSIGAFVHFNWPLVAPRDRQFLSVYVYFVFLEYPAWHSIIFTFYICILKKKNNFLFFFKKQKFIAEFHDSICFFVRLLLCHHTKK